MTTKLGAPNAGRIPASALYQFNGPIYDAAVDGFFNFPYQQDVIQDAANSTDATVVTLRYDFTLTDSIVFTATLQSDRGVGVLDTSAFSDTIENNRSVLSDLNDVVDIPDVLEGNGILSLTWSEFIQVQEAITVALSGVATATDDVIFYDVAQHNATQELSIADVLNFSEAQQPSVVGQSLVADLIDITDAQDRNTKLDFSLTDAVNATENQQINLIFNLLFTDLVGLSEAAEGARILRNTLGDTFSVSSTVQRGLARDGTLADNVTISSLINRYIKLFVLLNESLNSFDSLQVSQRDREIIADQFSLNGLTAFVRNVVVIDALRAVDTNKLNYAAAVLQETSRVRDNPASAPLLKLADSLNIQSDDLIKLIVRKTSLDVIAAQDIFDAHMIYQPAQNEIVRTTEKIIAGFKANVLETFTLQDTFNIVRGLRVLEKLGFNVATIANSINTLNITEQSRLLDNLARFTSENILDNLSISDIQLPKFFLMRGVNDVVNVSDQNSAYFILRVTANETVNINDSDVLQYIFQPTLRENINLTAAYISPNATMTTWAINTANNAVSEYTNYRFNSFAEMQNCYLGASEYGLFELDGDSDDGSDIIARLKTGLMQINNSRFAAFKAAYLGVRGGGDWVLKIVTGDDKEYLYSVVAQDMRTTKVRLGKGLRSRYFAFELISAGQDFDLDNIEFVPMLANRRV